MRRRIWLGVSGGVLALVLVTTLLSGAVFAQDSDTSATGFGQQFVERLAEKLGITSDELRAAVQDTQAEMIDEAVEDGRLTEQQAATMKERLESADGWFHAWPGPRHAGPRFDHGRAHHMLGGGVNLEAIADELGLTTAELREQLADGATLLEIIEASDKTVDDVVAVLVERVKPMLDQAVANGRITQEQADAKLAQMSERLTKMIESGLGCPMDLDLDVDAGATETTS